MQELTREIAIDILMNDPYIYGHELGFNKLIELNNDWIIDMVFGEGDDTLQAHRNSYKTTCVSIALTVIIILFPNDKTLFMRKTDDDVKEIIAQTIKNLKNPLTKIIVQAIWGVDFKITKENAYEISTNLTNDPRGTSQLVGMGSKASITGRHFDRIFTDDIVNVDDRTSRAERERTKTVYQELHNIVNRGGRIYNTGTPWHKDDAFQLMPTPKKYDCYSTGIMTPENISEKKNSMLASLFAANYELRHIASEDVIFSNPVIGADSSVIDQARYAHVDAAYSGSDYTAFTICKKVDGKYYVFGKMWRKHVDDCENEIIEWRKHFNAGKICCEDNGDKGYLAKDLRNRGERVYDYHESTNKYLKITSYLKGVWQDVVFVDGTDKEYIDQITDYNENAEHDDAPDSLASIIRLLYSKNDENKRRPSIFM